MGDATPDFEVVAIPSDIPKDVPKSGSAAPLLEGDGYTPPDDATPEAPYGYTPTGRIRKRPVGSSTRSSRGSMPASESMARQAASLLGMANRLIGMAIMAPLPSTAMAIADANASFEEQAYQALLTDPTMCKKILSTGASSGKAGLVMAYGVFGMSILPAARTEIAAKRREKEVEETTHAA